MHAQCKAHTAALLLALFLYIPDALGEASFKRVTDRPLISAIDSGNLADVEALLRMPSIDPNDFSDTHYAPIHAAAAKGDIRIVGALLAKGVDINLLDKHVQRKTPLFYAIDWGLLKMVEFLVTNGANVNASTSHGYTALHMAASADENALQMVRFLVNRGADPNSVAMNKTTVLESAVQKDNADVVNFLLRAGANPEATTYFGATVVNAAALGSHNEILRLLLKRRVSLVQRDSMAGFAPLHNAAYKGNIQAVKLLLEAGADPSFLTTNGKLAEEIAESRDHHELAELLRQARKNR